MSKNTGTANMSVAISYIEDDAFKLARAPILDSTIQFDNRTRFASTRFHAFNHLSGGTSSNHPHLLSTSGNFPDVGTTEAFLRRFSGIREPHLLILENIPGPRTIGRLPGSTELAVAIAVWSSPEKMLSLQGIYDTIENAFFDLRDMPDKPWKRTIRHTLSLKGMFTAVSRIAGGRGKYWALNVARSSTEKRQRKRRQPKNPREMPPTKAASPESQISDLDHDYSEIWLNNLHMHEVAAQAELLSGGELTNALTALQNPIPINTLNMFGPPWDAFIHFPLPSPAFPVDFDWDAVSDHGNNQQAVSTLALVNTESIYPPYLFTTDMPHSSFGFGQ